MTSLVGKIDSFKPENERFSIYVERLNLYFEANSVPDDKQIAVFLTVIGTKNYALLSDRYAPVSPKDQRLFNLIGTLKAHFQPEPIIIAERFLFYKRDQKPGETISDFVADLRRLAANCRFGAHLSDALRDRFVCGLNVESIQKELLTKKALTMEDADKHALSWSSAEKTSRAIHAGKSATSSSVVHAMHHDRVMNSGTSSNTSGLRTRHNSHNNSSCYRCGKPGHSPLPQTAWQNEQYKLLNNEFPKLKVLFMKDYLGFSLHIG